jgi:hypothetical protein
VQEKKKLLSLVPVEMKQEWANVFFATTTTKMSKKKANPFDKDKRALSHLIRTENSVLNSEIGLPR